MWKRNFKETPRKVIREAEEMAALIEMKEIQRRHLNRRVSSFLVEKPSNKIIAPERVQDAIDREDLELWMTAWNE